MIADRQQTRCVSCRQSLEAIALDREARRLSSTPEDSPDGLGTERRLYVSTHFLRAKRSPLRVKTLS
jgi:hypothetical protein